MEAMIFAAGLGSRLLGETADKPKALVEVGGKPLLGHAIGKLVSAGAQKIVVNVHHFAGQIIDFARSREWDIPVLVSDETRQLLDTGGGLKKASRLFSGKAPVLLYNVDVLSDIDLRGLLQYHQENRALATLAVRKRETQRYFKFDKQMQLVGWLNKKNGETIIARPGIFDTAEELAFSGIHVVSPQLFALFPEQDRFSLISVYLELAKTHIIKGYLHQNDSWADVGKPAELAEARKLCVK
ncbi:MAG: nucleotidyltransferase family protein [Draconibacterium sp.]